MKKIAYDQVKLDQARIIQDTKCCLKVSAVITKAGVYKYPEGKALKSTMELLKATRTARYAKITLDAHPPNLVIMSQREIYGGVEGPFWDRNRMRAVLNFDKAVTPKTILQKVRDAVAKKTGLDLSIGFYYVPDWTPGTDKNVNTGETERYDFAMRDIVIDHVAVGVLKGRCTFPSCGIGVDAAMRRINIEVDKVVKRGSQWCVVHCHPDGSMGKTIKCFPTKEEANAMHGAIMAHKSSAALDALIKDLIFGDQDKKPPKDWMDTCQSKARSFADNPGAFCGWIWYHQPELKRSFGGSSVSTLGGIKRNMSEEEASTFEECVRQRMEENPEMTREQAEALCKPPTKPEDEVTPPGGTLTDQELSPWQKCIKEEMTGEKTMEEAIEACKAKGVVKGDQDAAFENCVNRKMEEGATREDAEKACREEHPVGDQEAEKTPLERCVEEQMEQGKSAEEAKEWCEAELAGEHVETDEIIDRSRKLREMKAERDIEKRRAHLNQPA